MSQPWPPPPPDGASGQPGYGYPQQGAPQPGYGYPGAPPPQPGYGYPGTPSAQPGYGFPQQPGYPGQQPGHPGQQPMYGAHQPGPGGYPPPAGQEKAGLALLLGLVGALVGACAYVLAMNLAFDEDSFEFGTVGYMAVVVGVLAGVGPGLLARGTLWVHMVVALLTVPLAYFGELFGFVLGPSEDFGEAFEAFFQEFGDVWELWTELSSWYHFALPLLAPIAAILTSQMLARRRP